MNNLIPAESIESKIFLIRGEKVLLDKDIAELYGIDVKILNQAVSRNLSRFPHDFAFRLTKREHKNLMFQIGTSNLKSQIVTSSWGGARKLSRVFTEQGISMLSSVLRNKKAIQVNILIMRTFVKIRKYLSSHADLANKLKELEQNYKKHDHKIHSIINTIQKLVAHEEKPKKRIGFITEKE
ncbi:MAG: ORF6N domain-containing protein [Candidatus Margulisiibacteriota bacterium]|nr:ORF6N domain-containing protein [Candidatus Margulisiibacteriota bacterium]